MPTVKRVPNDTGASGKPGVLHVYSYVKLGPLGTRMVEVLSYYPKAHEIYVTSGMDGQHGSASHHYGQLYAGHPTAAVDVGARDKVGIAEGARRMRDLAKWLEDVVGYQHLLELIHMTPYADDNGFYVKHGRKLGGSGFGAATNRAHQDHVHQAQSAPQVEASLTTVKRLYGKTTPPPTPAPAPAPSTTGVLYGWDASDFDHDRGMRANHIQAAAREGIRFFTHKATEGTKVTHEHCGEKLKAAVAAGIPFVGAYVVPRTPGDSGHGSIAQQADYAIAQLTKLFPAWRTTAGFFWQVDLEHWPYDKVAPGHGVALAKALRERTGKPVILYAPKWAYGDTIPGSDPLWASSYGKNPAVGFKAAYMAGGGAKHPGWGRYSGRVPVILQYGSKAVIGGQHTCDANAFRGSEAEFAKLLKLPAPAPAKPAAPKPPAPKPVARTHTVKRGENLTVIAAKHKTTVAKLVSLNKLRDPDRIDVGQVLKLP